jgi:hypothetical protein
MAIRAGPTCAAARRVGCCGRVKGIEASLIDVSRLESVIFVLTRLLANELSETAGILQSFPHPAPEGPTIPLLLV